MGKRSDFKPRPQDKYYTPEEAIFPLLPHIPIPSNFVEPCAGDGRLTRHLTNAGLKCTWESDIEPDADMYIYDAMKLQKYMLGDVDLIITNPPWSRPILHDMIEYLPTLAPTWLLFDADWMHTRQAAELIKKCSLIVSIGRVKWIEGSKSTGKDNCCWYHFPYHGYKDGPLFVGREPLLRTPKS